MDKIDPYFLFRCEELGLLGRSKHIEPRLATRTEILTVHTEEHIEKLQKICENPEITVEELERHSSNYDAIYLHPTTYNLSLLAAGSTIDLVNNVLNGHVQNGMAIIRPPGHHAMKAEYCGYCYFNNVAIAAKKALEEGRASKILIVDFDVHHGQATQQAFYDDPRYVMQSCIVNVLKTAHCFHLAANQCQLFDLFVCTEFFISPLIDLNMECFGQIWKSRILTTLGHRMVLDSIVTFH